MSVEPSEYNFLKLAELIKDNDALNNLSVDQAHQTIQQGVAGLLYQRSLQSQEKQKNLQQANKPSDSYEILRKSALISEATAIVRLDAVLALNELAAADKVKVLLMKGFAFGYQIYPNAGSRASSDVDILIDKADVDVVKTIFEKLGYTIELPEEQSLLSFQFSALKQSNTGHTILFDIHYRINNRLQYDRYFDFDTLYDNAFVINKLSQPIKVLNFSEAYTFLCVHLQGHFLQGDPIKLIWLYDIHLLLSQLPDAELARIIKQLARFNKDDLGEVCRYWTEKTQIYFATKVPVLLKKSLDNYPDVSVQQQVSPIKLLWQQFKYMPNNRARLVFVRQLFLPPINRIRQKYPDSNLWLPLLYFKRVFDGFLSRLLKTGK